MDEEKTFFEKKSFGLHSNDQNQFTIRSKKIVFAKYGLLLP